MSEKQDFEALVAAVCEHEQALNSFNWAQLAFLLYGNGSRRQDIGHLLSCNTRYWTKAAGMYNITFRWDMIAQDGLLPVPTCPSFQKLSQCVWDCRQIDGPLDYGELACLLYDNEEPASRRKVATTLMSHRVYFQFHDGAKVQLLWDRIGFKSEDNSTSPTEQEFPCNSVLIEHLLQALQQEYRDAITYARKTPQVVIDLERVSTSLIDGICYKGKLREREDEDPVMLLEGMPILVAWEGSTLVSAVLLVYDLKTNEVVIQFTSSPLGSTCKIYPDTARLLKGYDPFVLRLGENSLVQLLLRGQNGLRMAECGDLHVDELRPVQNNFVRAALTNPIVYLWGPPGTGKTYTLAALIVELILRGKRVLATSISNSAVDELAMDVYERLRRSDRGRQLLAEGKVLRMGFAGNELLKCEELFPHRHGIRDIVGQLSAARQSRTSATTPEAKAKVQQKILELQKQLSEKMRDSLNDAQVVLTTIAQVTLVKQFSIQPQDSDVVVRPFHSVLCDEASMMNLPHIIPAASWGTERLVVAGDYKQLGPVVVCQSALAKRYLHRSLFDLELARPEKQKRILQLTDQGRMHDSICEIINKPFYDGLLKTLPRHSTKVPYMMSEARSRMGLFNVMDGETCMTSQRSRHNPRQAGIVLALLLRLLEYKHEDEYAYKKIGIVTPYRAQVNRIRRLLNLVELDKSNRVQVGTVHAFQGAEADVIIWDLVDSSVIRRPDGKIDPNRRGKPGLLYADTNGDRLINVAISRAREALYIIGDIGTFLEACPNKRLPGILRAIRSEGHCWDAGTFFSEDYIAELQATYQKGNDEQEPMKLS